MKSNMKHLLIILLAFGLRNSNAQKFEILNKISADSQRLLTDHLIFSDPSNFITPAPLVTPLISNLITRSVTPLNNDTLFIPEGKYKFVKIGDAIYKINASLEKIDADTSPVLRGILGVDSGFYHPYPIRYYRDGLYSLPNAGN